MTLPPGLKSSVVRSTLQASVRSTAGNDWMAVTTFEGIPAIICSRDGRIMAPIALRPTLIPTLPVETQQE